MTSRREAGVPGRAWSLLMALRPHQWVKNLLVFVPLFSAHAWSDGPRLLNAVLAFLSFSAAASAVYVVNDLIDLPHDRQHPTKRRRPFASGRLAVRTGWVAVPGLVVLAALPTLALPPRFALLVGAYVVLAMAYAVRLKTFPILDVLLLASFYTLRMLGGAAATVVEPSFWLLAFAMFIFLSLALVKRVAELVNLPATAAGWSPGRGYSATDLEVLPALGAASGYLAVLVLALYINSDAVRDMYAHPARLWLVCPLLLYWVSWIWLQAGRGQVRDDPLVHALSDWVSWSVVALVLTVLAVAI